jgi:TRAP transporter TAXI family solute receptor
MSMVRILFAAALAGGVAVTPAHADNYRLMTGPQGGVWVPLGGSLKNIWEKAIPGLTIQTLPGAGIANVRGVDEDKAEIGFGNSISTVDGVAGREPFPRQAANVCQLASLYPQYFQVVVNADSGISKLADLKGKSVAIQTRGNTAELITRQLLETVGLAYKDIKPNFQASYTDAAGLLKDGHAQAFTLGTTIPASSVMDLAVSRTITVLDLKPHIDAMRKLNPGYYAIDLPANTYPGQTTAVTQIGYAAHLFVSCKLPEERVHRMMKAMVDALPDLVAVNKAMQGLTPKQMAIDIGVKLHPGAARFYREAGAL